MADQTPEAAAVALILKLAIEESPSDSSEMSVRLIHEWHRIFRAAEWRLVGPFHGTLDVSAGSGFASFIGRPDAVGLEKLIAALKTARPAMFLMGEYQAGDASNHRAAVLLSVIERLVTRMAIRELSLASQPKSEVGVLVGAPVHDVASVSTQPIGTTENLVGSAQMRRAEVTTEGETEDEADEALWATTAEVWARCLDGISSLRADLKSVQDTLERGA